jgi:endoglucanase
MARLSLLQLAVLVSSTTAQQPLYAQCGGQGWTGTTTCVSGAVCTFQNAYYSQCLPGTAPPSATTRTTTTRATTAGPAPTSGSGKFKWFGINQSGAEFGQTILPGTWGKEFIFPAESSVSVSPLKGLSLFFCAPLIRHQDPRLSRLQHDARLLLHGAPRPKQPDR